MPGTSLLQVSSRQFSKVYDYAKDVMENGKRLISTKTKSAEVTEQRHEIHKGHQQEDENIVEQHRGPFYKSQVPRKEWLKEIPFFLYPLEDFPSFWGPNSTCDYKRILNPKHDAYIYAIQAMKRHPWRTSDPHEAKLAILPISLDHKKQSPIGCPGLKESTIVEEVEKVIQSSSIFPTIRHVFIAQDFRTQPFAKRIFSLLKPAGIWSHSESRGDCKTSLPYNTNYASYMSMRKPNGWQLPNPAPLGSKRTYSINMVGKFDSLRHYRTRMALFGSSESESLHNSFIVTSSSSATDKSYSREQSFTKSQ